MHFAGLVFVLVLFIGGFVTAQLTFYKMTGRTFWRAMLPTTVRLTLIPEDKVAMDSFMVMEEWAAITLYGSFLTLPLFTLNAMGFINFL